MIGFLHGTVQSQGVGSVILRIGDVGYRVFTVGFTALNEERLELFIYDHIREDRRELYGFKDEHMMTLFERLIDISGVGTKLAQKILNAGSSEEISSKIITGDLTFLTSISGVGKKTAQKIILELKGVLVQDEVSTTDEDAVTALMSLGYSRQDAVSVLNSVEARSTEERIRKALNSFGEN